jgi:exopolyphosphatase / guanosine-5'-triphosphate,3'-diphosphate pyrophosphatase
LGIKPTSFVLADIGGGSTELTRYDERSIETVSLNYGIVTLSESGESGLDEKIQTFKNAVQKNISNQSSTLVLTAGTPTTIAAYLNGMDYATYDPVKINGYRLRLSDCFRVHKELLEMDVSTRIRYVGLGRENFIIIGIRMVTSIYEAMGCEEAIIIDDGLREGIALEYYNQP